MISPKHIANTRKAIRFCPQGHEYTPENTRVYRGERICRECMRTRALAAYHNKYRAQRVGNPAFLEKHNQAHERYRQRHPERYKRLAATARRAHRAKNKTAVIAAYGGKCVRCGFSDPRALQIDHIDGKGHLDRKNRAGDAFYRFLLKNNCPTDNYQLLCANCNWIKRFEQHEYRGSSEPYTGTRGGDRRSAKYRASAVGA